MPYTLRLVLSASCDMVILAIAAVKVLHKRCNYVANRINCV